MATVCVKHSPRRILTRQVSIGRAWVKKVPSPSWSTPSSSSSADAIRTMLDFTSSIVGGGGCARSSIAGVVSADVGLLFSVRADCGLSCVLGGGYSTAYLLFGGGAGRSLDGRMLPGCLSLPADFCSPVPDASPLATPLSGSITLHLTAMLPCQLCSNLLGILRRTNRTNAHPEKSV